MHSACSDPSGAVSLFCSVGFGAGASGSSLVSRSGCLPELAGVAVCAEDGDGSVGDELSSGVVCDGDGGMKCRIGFTSGVIGSMATEGGGMKG